MGPLEIQWPFLLEFVMDIYVYSDESGVLDKEHNSFYTYGGLIFLDKSSKDGSSRKYVNTENSIRASGHYPPRSELKASRLSIRDKRRLFSSLNGEILFGAVIEQNSVYDIIFESKKSKQRYLDFVYKICLKSALEAFISSGCIPLGEDINLHIYADEHTTATDGRYELKEAIYQEFKIGTFKYDFSGMMFPPILKNLQNVEIVFCNSARVPLIRAADIVANRLFHDAESGTETQSDNLYVRRFPS